jgi:hypothetical protein
MNDTNDDNEYITKIKFDIKIKSFDLVFKNVTYKLIGNKLI